MQQQFQQNQPQQQAGYMAEPPNVLTTKDTLYLTDMLSWNLLAMKKAHFFAVQCHDPQIVEAMNQCGRMHQQHYETLLTHLQADPQQSQSFQ